MPEYYIPANFEDSGKLLGIFPIRNVIEAAIVSLPIAFLVFAFISLSLTWKIILAATFIIPIGGFALIGVNDDPLSVFARSVWQWLRNRKIIEYRGEIK